MLVLLLSIAYIPYWPHPVGPSPTHSLTFGWVGGCPGVGSVLMRCHSRHGLPLPSPPRVGGAGEGVAWPVGCRDEKSLR